LYDDDAILLAPSVQALQSLVDISNSELEFIDMAINMRVISMYALPSMVQKYLR